MYSTGHLKREATRNEENSTAAHIYADMPDLQELHALIKKHAPIIYFHPDEEYNISCVESYLENCYLVNDSLKAFTQARVNKLPERSKVRDTYSLRFKTPSARSVTGNTAKGSVKTYVRAKPHAESHIDLQFWFLFPWSGPVTAAIKQASGNGSTAASEAMLDPLGAQEGCWKHFTLRIDKTNKALSQVYLSQREEGVWALPPELETSGDRVIIYLSKNTHAFYSTPGIHFSEPFRMHVKSGDLEFSFKNITAKGTAFDCSLHYELVSAPHLAEDSPLPPSWLEYSFRWGKEDMSALNQGSLREIITNGFGASYGSLSDNAVATDLLAYLQTLFTRELQNISTGPAFQDFWNG